MQGTIAMDEASARQVLLAQAIESNDPQGRLVTDAEREQIDREAVAAARGAGEAVAGPAAIVRFLLARAALVLAMAARRDRAIASLLQAGAGERWIAAAIPLAALLLGIFTDQVANPHQVNLLSKPLLLLLLWNVVVYALLAAHLLWPGGQPPRPPRFFALRQWLAGLRDWRREPRPLRAEVTAAFLARWQAATAALHGQRLARVMHLSAAAWALGVGLSLFFGGVWASYGVQWESTFLSAGDVHRFLSILFKPVTALFPWASFSLEEVRSLRAAGPLPSPPEAGDNFTGRRWVFLYTMLLALVIVLPRVALAALAWWRERGLARAVTVDAGNDYYGRLVTLLSPVQVQLALLAHRDEDRDAVLRVLGAGAAADGRLIETPGGERLRLIELPRAAQTRSSPEAALQHASPVRKIVARLWRKPAQKASALQSPREEIDVVLHVVGRAADLAGGSGLLQRLDRPVLVLMNGDLEPGRDGADAASVLPFDRFARCWVQERTLLDAIGRCLPRYKAAGFAKLARAWEERNEQRLRESMSVIARHLMDAARQTEDVGKAPRSLVSLVRPSERDAHQHRSREAMAAVVERLQRSQADANLNLLVLHGLDAAQAGAVNLQLEEKFVVQQAISAGQAGVAGAATGAAMGVSIDLLTAGLSLGLGALAGAVVGGGAAWVAAVWKNQATPAGHSVVQLSDDMLQAMAEAGLLRYLAIVHFGRGPATPDDAAELRPEWRSEVVAAVEQRRADLREQWANARARQDGLEPTAALAAMLESIALSVLRRLYPDPPP